MSSHLLMNPESLVILSGNAVMRQPKQYPYKGGRIEYYSHNYKKNNLELLTDEDIRLLLQDTNLIRERIELDNYNYNFLSNWDDNDPIIGSMTNDDKLEFLRSVADKRYLISHDIRMSDDENILFYLINIHPLMGMKYAAIYGIDRLFLAAKTEYFNKYRIHTRTENAFKHFQNFLYKNVLANSVKSGSINIFKYCVKYLRPDQTISYSDALKLAIDNNRDEMVVYLKKKIQKLFYYAVYFNKIKVVEDLLARHRAILRDDQGEMLETTIKRSSSTHIFHLLFNRFLYTDEILTGVIVRVVRNDKVEFYEQYERMIVILLQRIDPNWIKLYKSDILTNAASRVYKCISHKIDSLIE